MPGLGWNPELEAQHATELARVQKPMFPCAPSSLPDAIDLLGIIPCNNQGPFNSCEGNARAKVAELCNYIKTGEWQKISSRYAYLTTKKQDGTLNEGDQGASISGGVLASKTYGECLEKTMPYWDWQNNERYSNGIPQEAFNIGSDHRLRSSTPITDLDSAVAFVGSGQGGVLFGIIWDDVLASNTDGLITRVGGGVQGGHAICALGYETRAGEKWMRMWNSHSDRWGNQGTALVAPRIWEQWARNSPFGMIGVSDLPEFTSARPFKSWEGIMG